MNTFGDMLTIWGPMILLLVVYSFFMARLKSPQNQTIGYLKKQTEMMGQFLQIMERIAVSLEKIEHR